ncbi:glycogen debranching N-terminal domain-containing protein [Streptacidiphilus sp. EB129]|uniref:glycogen debranching N-terminal domain-containing protein n=1 Tax=Streptacidiphilus sp. EB129 TaxID=3156262 RepID=UPI0035192FBA
MFASDGPSGRYLLQPLLHDAAICVSAPAFAVSARDGQLRGAGADGFYDRDRRLLHTLHLAVDEREPEAIGCHPLGPDRMRFTAVHRYPGDPTDDPTVLIERVRGADGTETITVRNDGARDRRLRIDVAAATDLTDIATVKSGRGATPLPAVATPTGLSWSLVGPEGESHSTLTVEPAPGAAATRPNAFGPVTSQPEISDGPEGGTLTWPVLLLRPGARWQVTLRVRGRSSPLPPGQPDAPTLEAPWSVPTVEGDRRLVALVRRGLADLRALRLADPMSRDGDGHEDQFVAAGCPWYLALFGRDSIWAARMLLPLGTGLALGTLRTLARRQGRSHDRFREEAPGRILHELRPGEARHGRGLRLPAHYYGSVDATPLFVTLLVEAWHWGLPTAEVERLLPHAELAMDWVQRSCGQDQDGLLRYRPRPGGLVHQSWKDSTDAVRDALGRHIPPPLALCEVQGYAYQAAVGLAGLVAALGRADRAAELRAWALGLRKSFRDAFWVDAGDADAPASRYVAIAVGRALSPVTGPASNMGQLPDTGILDPADCRDVAAWLCSAELNSGWGLRSRSALVPGFNPLSYHGGSVWTHDTAIAVQGLCAAGRHAEAARLTDGLLDAATHFQYRMPELYGGDERTPDTPGPLDYPAACRPQGWSAAAGVALLGALLGLRPDAAARVLTVRPMPPEFLGPLSATGLRLAGARLDVAVDRTGAVCVDGLPEGWHLRTEGP